MNLNGDSAILSVEDQVKYQQYFAKIRLANDQFYAALKRVTDHDLAVAPAALLEKMRHAAKLAEEVEAPQFIVGKHEKFMAGLTHLIEYFAKYLSNQNIAEDEDEDVAISQVGMLLLIVLVELYEKDAAAFFQNINKQIASGATEYLFDWSVVVDAR